MTDSYYNGATVIVSPPRLRVQVCLFQPCFSLVCQMSTESRLLFIRDRVQGLCFCEHATSYVVRVLDHWDVSVKRGAQAVQGRL
jgi:hypothetical protein